MIGILQNFLYLLFPEYDKIILMKTKIFSLINELNSSDSLISRFTRSFFLTIILPTLILWGIYLVVLYGYLVKNTLSIQQNYLKSSLSTLELSISNTDQFFSALESIPEVTYYLDVYSSKSDMLYSLMKTIRSQCSNLRTENASVQSFRIYSDKPSLLYVEPFYPFSSIPLKEKEQQQLLQSVPTDILWYTVSDSTQTVPRLLAYKKLSPYNYDHVIGYMEVTLSPQILTDYFSQFEGGTPFPDSRFAVYQDGRLLYSSHDSSLLPAGEELSSASPDGFTVNFFSGEYVNLVSLPEVNLQFVLTGKLLDLFGQSDNFLVPMIVFIICLLFFLLIRFFTSITDLSRQLMDFSTYIQNSDPDNLSFYFLDTRRYRHTYDEISHLVSSYNHLFRDNSTLMSKVEKMELLNQDAMYQALQAQIHPHFIYGTLENIRMLALQNQDKMVADMIFSLSALIRESVSISSKANTLKDELDIAGHYLKIQKYRFGNRLDYSFDIEYSLLSMKLPSFILQPILENSILYGASETFEPCTLTVSARLGPEQIVLVLSNSGQTITPERLAEVNALLEGSRKLSDFRSSRNGCALYNIKERLHIFFHGKASLSMALTEDSTQTLITIERSALHVSDPDSR